MVYSTYLAPSQYYEAQYVKIVSVMYTQAIARWKCKTLKRIGKKYHYQEMHAYLSHPFFLEVEI